MWIFKYAPKTIEECAGNDEARAEIKTWAIEWDRGKPSKPILIAGPPGSGKTALAYAMAQQMGWTLIEASTSDDRGKEELERLFGKGAPARGLFGGMRMMLIEDVDSVFDRGEVPELLRAIGDARLPIVFTANDAWEPKITALRANCKVVEFKAVNTRAVAKVLNTIATKEGRNPEFVEGIAATCKGDLRSAIIDFEYGTSAARERKANVFRAVGKVFNATSYLDAIKASDEADVDLDMLVRWIEENITAEYEDPEEVATAFERLSRAEVFKGRISRRQAWGFLKYYRALATAGVAMSKRRKYFKFTRYAFPAYIKMMSQSRAARMARTGIAKKAGRRLHCSGSQAIETMAMLKPDSEFARTLELSETEEEYFKENYAAKKEAARKTTATRKKTTSP